MPRDAAAWLSSNALFTGAWHRRPCKEQGRVGAPSLPRTEDAELSDEICRLYLESVSWKRRTQIMDDRMIIHPLPPRERAGVGVRFVQVLCAFVTACFSLLALEARARTT